jgi:hypothetical protein
MLVTVKKTMGKITKPNKESDNDNVWKVSNYRNGISDIQIDLRYNRTGIHLEYTGTTLLRSTKLIFKLINL